MVPLQHDSLPNHCINTKRKNRWTAFKPTGEVIAKDKKQRYYPYSKDELDEFYAKNLHKVDLNGYESIRSNLGDFMKEHRELINPNSNLIFQIGEKKYACQTNLNYISDGKNEKVEIIKTNEKNRLYSFKTKEGEGIVSFDNKVLLSAGDREIYTLENNYIVIKKDGTYSIYDLKLKKLHFFNFDYFRTSSNNNSLTKVAKRVPGSSYEYISESCISNTIDTLTGYKYRYGYIDKNGEIIIHLQYNYATEFYKGLALVGNKNENDIYQCYMIDTIGQILQTFDSGIKPVNWYINDEVLYVENGINRGCIYKNGDIFIDIKYKSIHKFIGYDIRNYNPIDYNLFMVYKHDDTNYLINKKGDVLYANTKMTERDYHNILPIQNDLVLVYPDDKIQIINIETGEKFVKFSGDKVELVSSVDMLLIKVYQDDQFYCIFRSY